MERKFRGTAWAAAVHRLRLATKPVVTSGPAAGRVRRIAVAAVTAGVITALLPALRAQESSVGETAVVPAEESAAAGVDAPEPADRLLDLEESVALALELNYGIRQERRSFQMAEADLKYAHAERFLPRGWSDFLLPSYAKRTVEDFDPETGTNRFYPNESMLYDGNFHVALPIFSGGQFRFDYSAFRLDQDAGGEDARTYSNTTRLSFNQPFLGDNVQRLAETRARYGLEIAEESYRRRIVGLRYDVSSAYYGLVNAIKQVEIGQDRLKQSEASYEMARKKYQAGLIPEVEMLQLEVERDNSEADLATALANRQRMEDMFRNILGLDLDEPVGVVTDVAMSLEEIDVAEAIREALASRSDIREREIQLELGRLDLRSIRRDNNVSGNFSLYYEYDGKDESFSESIDQWRNNQGAMFSLSVPIFDAGRNRARVTRQELSLENQQLSLEELRRNIELEVRAAARAVKEARLRLEILESTLEVAGRTYDINLQRFEVGRLTSQELFQEEVRLNQARLNHLDALISCNLAWANFIRVVNQ